MEELPFESEFSASEERLAGLIAVLGIERLTPVLERMDPKEQFVIRQLAARPVRWEVVEKARTELRERLADRKDEARFRRPDEYYA